MTDIDDPILSERQFDTAIRRLLHQDPCEVASLGPNPLDMLKRHDTAVRTKMQLLCECPDEAVAMFCPVHNTKNYLREYGPNKVKIADDPTDPPSTGETQMTEGYPITASWRIQCDRCEDIFYRATECFGERTYRRGTHELPDLLPDGWRFVDGDLVCDVDERARKAVLDRLATPDTPEEEKND